jgi:L-threonylcarbamoyladenylate synthase
VFVGDYSQVETLAAEVPPEAEALMDYYWPGPLTLIFKKRDEVPDAVTGGLPTIAIRMPGSIIAQAILAEAGMPLASSSANVSGGQPPRDPAGIAPRILDGVDIVVDGRLCPDGQPSTILDVSGPVWRVLRQGRVTREAIETAVGRVVE